MVEGEFQMTYLWVRLVFPLCNSALLSWLNGSCPPGVLDLLWSLQSPPPSLHPPAMRFPELQGEGLTETSNLDTLSIMSDCGSLVLAPICYRRTSDDAPTRHWSASIDEYPWGVFRWYFWGWSSHVWFYLRFLGYQVSWFRRCWEIPLVTIFCLGITEYL